MAGSAAGSSEWSLSASARNLRHPAAKYSAPHEHGCPNNTDDDDDGTTTTTTTTS